MQNIQTSTLTVTEPTSGIRVVYVVADIDTYRGAP